MSHCTTFPFRLVSPQADRTSRPISSGPRAVILDDEDPRLFLNEENRNPCSVAIANGRWACMTILNPITPLVDIISNGATGERVLGPVKLKELAAQVTGIRCEKNIHLRILCGEWGNFHLSERLCGEFHGCSTGWGYSRVVGVSAILHYVRVQLYHTDISLMIRLTGDEVRTSVTLHFHGRHTSLELL